LINIKTTITLKDFAGIVKESVVFVFHNPLLFILMLLCFVVADLMPTFASSFVDVSASLLGFIAVAVYYTGGKRIDVISCYLTLYNELLIFIKMALYVVISMYLLFSLLEFLIVPDTETVVPHVVSEESSNFVYYFAPLMLIAVVLDWFNYLLFDLVVLLVIFNRMPIGVVLECIFRFMRQSIKVVLLMSITGVLLRYVAGSFGSFSFIVDILFFYLSAFIVIKMMGLKKGDKEQEDKEFEFSFGKQ